MNLINTLTKPLRIKNIAKISPHFKFGAEKSKEELIKQYDQKIKRIQQMPEDDSKQDKYRAVIKQTSQKLKALKNQEQLKKIKDYLMQGLQNEKTSRQNKMRNQEKESGYIPINLVIKKLRFLDKKIFMLGVQEQNEDHCIYLKQMAQKMNSKIILTALPPDMPYFIKTQLSFVDEWQKFITNPKYAQECKFYLNPSPLHIAESSLTKTHAELVRSNMNKSKEFNQIFYTILQYSKRMNKFLPNALLTPLLINSAQKIYFCDYPILKERELWAMTIPLETLRNLFKVYHQQIYKDKKTMFDPRILFPKEIINRKFEHMANVVKYSTYESKQPVIFVCPAQYAQMFCMEFKKDKPVKQFSDFNFNLLGNKPATFIDFVEKLVLMDLMLEPIVQKYFVANLSFPYTAQHTLGGKQNIGRIFMVWKHFMSTYQQVLQKQPSY